MNTVSLHKVGIAKYTGLLVLSALAVFLFIVPTAWAAMGGGNNCGANKNLVPAINKGAKISFVGKVVAGPSISTSTNGMSLLLKKNLAVSDILSAGWGGVVIKDDTGVNPTHASYAFMATFANFKQNNVTITANDVRQHNVAVIIGLPVDTTLTPQSVVNKYVGKKGRLLYVLNGDQVLPPPGTEVTGTGW
jgi:hypothetical protein